LRLFNISHIFLVLYIDCLSLFNSLSCHSGLSIHIIFDWFLVLFVVWKVRVLSLLHWYHRLWLYAVQCCQHSDLFWVQATHVFIRWTTWSYRLHGRDDICACRKSRRVHFRNMDQCLLCWPCCSVSCWMLQDMDHMEASCIICVKVGRYHQFPHTKICVLIITWLEIVMLPVHYDKMISVWFMKDHGDVRIQTSPPAHSVKECLFYIYETCEFSCHSSRWIPVT
jgi:hypothetical protein